MLAYSPIQQEGMCRPKLEGIQGLYRTCYAYSHLFLGSSHSELLFITAGNQERDPPAIIIWPFGFPKSNPPKHQHP
jgi:hypothetical protein